MALVKIPLNESFAGLDAILKAYNGSIVNTNENYIAVMVADDTARIEGFLKTIKKYNPTDIVRGGSVLMDI